MSNTIVLGNPVNQWLLALTVALATYLALTLGPRWLARGLRVRAQRTGNWPPELLAQVLELTKLYFQVVTAIYAGGQLLQLPSSIERAIWVLFILGLTGQVAVWADRALAAYIERIWRQRQGESDAEDVTELRWISFVVKAAVWIIAALVALENIGVDVTALLAGLGIGGIAVALAVQSIVADLFSSLSIVMDKPFVLGDFITVGDQMGTVEDIGLKTTRLRSLSGEQIVFSNSDLLGSRVHNYGRMQERRVAFTFGVIYQTPAALLAEIPKLVREILEAHDRVRFDRAHFAEYGDSALIFEVVYFVESADYKLSMDIREQVNLELFRRLEERGIDFAYPTRTLYLADGANR